MKKVYFSILSLALLPTTGFSRDVDCSKETIEKRTDQVRSNNIMINDFRDSIINIKKDPTQDQIYGIKLEKYTADLRRRNVENKFYNLECEEFELKKIAANPKDLSKDDKVSLAAKLAKIKGEKTELANKFKKLTDEKKHLGMRQAGAVLKQAEKIEQLDKRSEKNELTPEDLAPMMIPLIKKDTFTFNKQRRQASTADSDLEEVNSAEVKPVAVSAGEISTEGNQNPQNPKKRTGILGMFGKKPGSASAKSAE